MKLVDAINLAVKSLQDVEVGQQNITKHDILKKMQKLDSSVKDGYVIGRAIFNLVVEGYLNKTGKKGNANLYERSK